MKDHRAVAPSAMPLRSKEDSAALIPTSMAWTDQSSAGIPRRRFPLLIPGLLKLILGLGLLVFLFRSKLVSVSIGSRTSITFGGDDGGDDSQHSVEAALQCAIQKLDTSALDQPGVEPIPFEEFVQRRDRIAQALVKEKLDAYIVEPGSDFNYLANLSNAAWEDWGPTERPFLLVIQALPNESRTEATRSRSTILTPNFELGRAKQLVLPFAPDDAKHLPWREEESPYAVLASHLSRSTGKPTPDIRIKVGPETRTFITQGLALAQLHVQPFLETDPVADVRQTKSEREVHIMRAINTLTVEAVRAVRTCVYDGISEAELFDVFKRTVLSAGHGISDVEGLALFGERTACPHCGPSASRRLKATEDFVLMDVGARLYGYISDCTRTFLLPNSTSSSTSPESFDPEKLKIWYKVHEAQAAAINAIRQGTPLSAVDHAAREVIDQAGYGQYFTHRLGHSIGLQMHESPYANGANTRVTLKANTPLTAEPGIYIEGFAGVRLEDVILTSKDGKEAQTLTNRRATSPWDP
ncbi:hypothetical protein OC835_000073 [Tilletia horrida]|nr:hypothetical protein OC835_000073 [Tilletia horrida]